VKRGRLWLALAARLAAGLLGALALVLRSALSPADPAGQETVFEVNPGQSVASVAARLERAGLVRDARAVVWLARWRDVADRLQSGEFALSPAMSPRQILEKIVAGRVVTHEVVIPEGFALAEIAERLAAAGLVEREEFLRVARDPATAAALGVQGETLEGYLFPDTYRLPRRLPALEVARVLVERFLAVWQELAPLAAARDFSMKDAVTLASIVEKETGAPDERPLIASVFANRLARGMRLETDPTVIYGIAGFDGNLRRAHLEDAANPYNTYRILGLPPGPIASPGRAALVAALAPAQTKYLYFVSRNDGTHVFSTSYREHAQAVERFQRRGQARAGQAGAAR
jgi:UPF0755 protein